MLPEVRLAQRLVERRGLCPPVDVEGILREYAIVEDVTFPVRIDGLCLDLKPIGKKPTVLVSKSSYPTRRRFTLAHELGHVLIPWHLGNIIDEIDATDHLEDNYYATEAEANRFASELLMPTKWVKEQFLFCENPLDALFRVFNLAEVSLQAASIKFVGCLPPNHVIASSIGGRVDWSSRSDGTLAAPVPRDTDLGVINPFPFPCERWTKIVNGTTFDLWHFTASDDLPTNNIQLPWRDILHVIVSSIIPDKIGQQKFKASINGVTSNANGMVHIDRHTKTIVSAMQQRLHASAMADWRFKELVEHPNSGPFAMPEQWTI